MTTHQLIYTSCKKGIINSTSGLQIYSFDKDYKSEISIYNRLPEGIGISAAYKEPSGIVPSKETIHQMPKVFAYYHYPDGRCSVTQTISSRDYSSLHGRWGSTFTHSIIYDESDTAFYPCELYGSQMFRDGLTTEEEVSNETPQYLPAPILQRGNIININSLSDFLLENDRIFIFKSMLQALLLADKEKKRIIICDEPVNIILWIAALGYSFPLKLAHNINFKSYEYDPSSSSFTICGVIPSNTAYNPADSSVKYGAYVFDFINNVITNIPTNALCDFIELNLPEPDSNLQEFHQFVTKFTHVGINEDYANVYCLYDLSKNGIAIVNHETFNGAIEFLKTIQSPNAEKSHIVEIILSDKKALLSINTEYFVDVMTFLFGVYSNLPIREKNQIKAIVIEQIINLYLNPSTSESQFKNYTHKMQEICGHNFVISDELLTNECVTHIKQNLFNASVSEWRLLYLHEILTNFGINKKAVNLEKENISGKLYLDMLKVAQNKFEFAKTILGAYVAHKEHFITLVFTLLDEFKTNTKEYWDYVIHLIAENQYDDRDWFYRKFLEHKLYPQVYTLYQTLLANQSATSETIKLFKEQRDIYLVKDEGYTAAYSNVIIRDFTTRIDKLVGPDVDSMKKELLKTSLMNNISIPESLPIEITKTIPMSDLSSEDTELLNDIATYYEQSKQLFTGRLRLLVVGSEISHGQNFEDTISKVDTVLKNSKISLSGSDNKEGMQFLQWVVPHIASLCKTKEELNLAFEKFNFSNSDYTRKYFTILTETYIQKINTSDGLKRLSEYIQFVSEQKDEKLKSNIIHQFKKELSKKDLANLDPLISDVSAKNRKVDELWSEIYKNKSVQSPDTKSNNKESSKSGSKDKHGLSNFFGMFKK